MNSLRDNLNWLKGFTANVTNGTDADTGATTYFRIVRAASTDNVLLGQVSGDTQPRFRVLASGRLDWGAGGVSSTDMSIQRVTTPVAVGDSLVMSATSAGSPGNRFWVQGSATPSQDAIGVFNPSDPAQFSALGVFAANKPTLTFSRTAGALVRFMNDADNRIVLDNGGGSGQARFLVVLASAATDTQAVGVHVDGDVSYRIALGITSAGLGRISFGSGAAIDVELWRSAAGVIKTDGDIDVENLRVNGVGVVGDRVTGWATATNTKSKATFDTTTVTLPNLAARVGQIIDDMFAHGLIGA